MDSSEISLTLYEQFVFLYVNVDMFNKLSPQTYGSGGTVRVGSISDPAIDKLIFHNLIRFDDLTNKFVRTERGDVYFNMIQSLPLPESVAIIRWVDPREVEK